MVDAKIPFRKATTTAALVLAVLASGCVRTSTFRTEMAQLRQEMQEGAAELDRRLSGRIEALDGRMLALESELLALEEQFDARVERLEDALRVHTPIHFGFDEARIEPDQVPVLERLGAVLREYYPQALITVEGFTDPAGSAAYNLELGQRRADEVRDHLVTRAGLAPVQVRSVSYGKDAARLVRPGEQGPGLRGRENRRVVIVIDHPDAWAVTTVTESELD